MFIIAAFDIVLPLFMNTYGP